MTMRDRLLAGLVVAALSLGGGMALAQEPSPPANPAPSPATVERDLSHIELKNPDGNVVATASVTADPHGVTIIITNTGDSGLTPGQHGVHIHEAGVCDASGDKPFESAGGHFNPTDNEHGAANSENTHAGDLGNLTVADDGSINFKISTLQVTLDPDALNSLDNPQGTSLVIHSGEDDLESQPSGDSGSRVACGVIFPPRDASMQGSPVATPTSVDATPAG